MIDRLVQLLRAPAPASEARRLLLYAIRRIAAGGLDDAFAAHAWFTAFGLGYRRPLVLMRALMAEMSRAAGGRIMVAPCCCPRMTPAEAAIIDAVASPDRATAHQLLAAVLGVEDCIGALLSAEALGHAFADLGRPLDAGST